MDTPTNLPGFQDACHDHVQIQGSSCCFPRELVSFVHPRKLYSFEVCHVIHSHPTEDCISVMRYDNNNRHLMYGPEGNS